MMKRSSPGTGKLVEKNKDWEMEVFLLDIITPYLTDSVLHYMDFVCWHATCKTTWRHIGPRLYGEYLGRFLASCLARNKALYNKMPHLETYKNLAMLRIIERVCLLVGKSVWLMTNIHTFDYVPLTMIGSLVEHGFIGTTLGVDDTDVLNITTHYMREKYGWHFLVYRIAKRTECVASPLSYKKIYGATKEYGIALSPTLNKDTVSAPDDHSILKLRKERTLS